MQLYGGDPHHAQAAAHNPENSAPEYHLTHLGQTSEYADPHPSYFAPDNSMESQMNQNVNVYDDHGPETQMADATDPEEQIGGGSRSHGYGLRQIVTPTSNATPEVLRAVKSRLRGVSRSPIPQPQFQAPSSPISQSQFRDESMPQDDADAEVLASMCVGVPCPTPSPPPPTCTSDPKATTFLAGPASIQDLAKLPPAPRDADTTILTTVLGQGDAVFESFLDRTEHTTLASVLPPGPRDVHRPSTDVADDNGVSPIPDGAQDGTMSGTEDDSYGAANIPATPGGRISSNDKQILNKYFSSINSLFEKAAAAVDRPIENVIKYWNGLHVISTRDCNDWNDYQAYHSFFYEQEVARVPHLKAPTVSQCWTQFKLDKPYPQYREELSTFKGLQNRVEKTIQERERDFKKHVKVLQTASDGGVNRSFETIFITLGNCVNEDSSGLACVVATPGLLDFFTCRLEIDEHVLLGLARTHAFDDVAKRYTKAYVARQASEALQTADVKAGVSATSNKPVPPTSKASTTNSKVAAARRITSPVLDDIGANNDASGSAAATTSDNDVYSACKTLLGALFDDAGHGFSKNSGGHFLLPWSTLRDKLYKRSLVMVGWPICVRFPTETAKAGMGSQGIKDLTGKEAHELEEALQLRRIKLVKADKSEIKAGKIPIITTEAPAPNDKVHTHGRNLYHDNTMDDLGLARRVETGDTRVKRKKKKPTPHDIISVTSGSPTPTPPLVKAQALKRRVPAATRVVPTIVLDDQPAEINDEMSSTDDDDEPLTTNKKRKIVPEIASVVDSDEDYSAEEQDLSEEETFRSPVKTRTNTAKRLKTIVAKNKKGKGKVTQRPPFLPQQQSTAHPAPRPLKKTGTVPVAPSDAALLFTPESSPAPMVSEQFLSPPPPTQPSAAESMAPRTVRHASTQPSAATLGATPRATRHMSAQPPAASLIAASQPARQTSNQPLATVSTAAPRSTYPTPAVAAGAAPPVSRPAAPIQSSVAMATAAPLATRLSVPRQPPAAGLPAARASAPPQPEASRPGVPRQPPAVNPPAAPPVSRATAPPQMSRSTVPGQPPAANPPTALPVFRVTAPPPAFHSVVPGQPPATNPPTAPPVAHTTAPRPASRQAVPMHPPAAPPPPVSAPDLTSDELMSKIHAKGKALADSFPQFGTQAPAVALRGVHVAHPGPPPPVPLGTRPVTTAGGPRLMLNAGHDGGGTAFGVSLPGSGVPTSTQTKYSHAARRINPSTYQNSVWTLPADHFQLPSHEDLAFTAGVADTADDHGGYEQDGYDDPSVHGVGGAGAGLREPYWRSSTPTGRTNNVPLRGQYLPVQNQRQTYGDEYLSDQAAEMHAGRVNVQPPVPYNNFAGPSRSVAHDYSLDAEAAMEVLDDPTAGDEV